jgi:DNA-binding CsgD family transcriptional regulator/tetratricopeptide (TPR) repeat protein
MLVERDALLAQLAEARREARREGGRLLLVGGEAGVGKTALVRAFVAGIDERVLTGACEPLATPAALGPLADVAAELGGPLASDIEAGRHPRQIALSLLDVVSRPTVLVFEDVHWADEATLDVLRVVGRRIAATPSLVVVTYREDEAGAAQPLGRLLGELASVAAAERVHVPPLSPAAVAELAAPLQADAEAIYTLTRGNPFFVTELLASGGEALPATVRDAVLARIGRLSPGARRLLDGVALAPARAELWLFDAAFPDVARHVDECVTAGVLEPAADGVGFRHELARLAVESTVPPRRRRDLNAAILRALETSAVDSSRLAHHADEAGDTEGVLRHGRVAAERGALTGAHREAAAQYARVLRHASGVAAADRAELLSAYAVEAQASGSYEEAITALNEAIELHRALGDRLGMGACLARLTSPDIVTGRNVEAEAASRTAIEILETLPPGPELAMAYASHAFVQMIRRDNDDAVTSGQKAVALARRFDLPETLAFALNAIGSALITAGEIDPGVGFLGQSLDVARAHQLDQRVAHALTNLGSALGEMYELERAERALRDTLGFDEEHDLDPAYERAWLAIVLVYRGRWTDGAALAAAVLTGAEPAVARIAANVALGRVRARRGDPGVGDALDEALALAESGAHLQRLGHVHAARAEAAWLAGDHERAAAEARAVYPLAVEKRHLWFAGELAYWQWKADGLREAPEWIAEPYRLQIEGSPVAASERWRERGCPYEAARALAESDDADNVMVALTEFEALGAMPAARPARQRLRELGVRAPRGPRSTTRANPAGLTTRELEVLSLIADGLRNAQVAERLVVTRKTVDHHVSAILRKLNVNTRGEAAATATRLGLLQDRSPPQRS